MKLPNLLSCTAFGLVAVAGWTCSWTLAQEAESAPASVMGVPEDPAEGEWFRSVEAGMELRLPPGEVTSASGITDPQLLAVVTNSDEEWRFELREVPLDRPMGLRTVELPQGGQRVGLLDLLADQVRREVDGDILRQDPIPLGDADAGLFVVRYSAGPEALGAPTLLRQDALIRASDTLYYRLTLISPAPSGETEELAQDAGVRRAVAAFKSTLDSYARVDQTQLREDQEQRLLRTRAMMVNLQVRGRLAEACAGEYWWRVRRDGEEMGYARVVEEPADRLPSNIRGGFEPSDRGDGTADHLNAEGIRVGIRLRLKTDGGNVLERRTWMYGSRDLNEADFRESNAIFTPGDGEFGAEAAGLVIGQMRSRLVPRQVQGENEAGLPKSMMAIDEHRELEVTFTLDGAVQGEPLERQLPEWYVPQAIDHLLPRLVARWGSRSYLVAIYAPDRREIMHKYIDVDDPRRVEVPGREQMQSAIVVTTRLGYSGDATRHFIDPETYAWLGSVNEGTGLEIIPTSREELAELWRDTPMMRE